MPCGRDHTARGAWPHDEGGGRRATPTRVVAERPTVHVAAVYGVDRVNLLAVAASRSGLYAKLGAYVQRQADLQLYPEEARRVQRLLETGQSEAAVRLYFASVGKRWDPEWLITDAVELTGG